MRYGIALLASTFTSPSRPNFPEDIRKKITSILTKKHEVPADHFEHFKDYLYKKPGSPRYDLLRKKIENRQPVRVDYQDLLLSDPALCSSVGALTKDYFDDALTLAHTLRLVVKHDQNLLLARGRLSLSTGWSADNPYRLNEKDTLFLGLWLLDADCDWIWAFLLQLSDDPGFEITIENRVELLLKSWKHVLSARQMRSGRPNVAKIRTRLNELIKITERNVIEKLNLGQPWSWFLIPRLELLVDAAILKKKERHGLTRYALTSTGLKLRIVCDSDNSGETLISNYFYCRDADDRPVEKNIKWDDIETKLEPLAAVLRTTVGYFPIFETAAALCVSQFMNTGSTRKPIWEIEGVKQTLWDESKSSSPRVRLGINRQGEIYTFKPEEKE